MRSTVTRLSEPGRSLCYRCSAWYYDIVPCDGDWYWIHECRSSLGCTPGDHVKFCRGYAMLAVIAMIKGLWNPAVLVLGIALFGGGLAAGDHLAEQAAKAEQLDAVQRAVAQANEIAGQDSEILATGDIKRATRRVAAKQLDQEIEKNVEANPSYLECGLDADGLRLWNAANAGFKPDLSGQRGYGLPQAAPGEVGKAWGFGAKPQGGDGSLPRVPGELPPSPETRQPSIPGK